jgi:hypothetical protein
MTDPDKSAKATRTRTWHESITLESEPRVQIPDADLIDQFIAILPQQQHTNPERVYLLKDYGNSDFAETLLHVIAQNVPLVSYTSSRTLYLGILAGFIHALRMYISYLSKKVAGEICEEDGDLSAEPAKSPEELATDLAQFKTLQESFKTLLAFFENSVLNPRERFGTRYTKAKFLNAITGSINVGIHHQRCKAMLKALNECQQTLGYQRTWPKLSQRHLFTIPSPFKPTPSTRVTRKRKAVNTSTTDVSTRRGDSKRRKNLKKKKNRQSDSESSERKSDSSVSSDSMRDSKKRKNLKKKKKKRQSDSESSEEKSDSSISSDEIEQSQTGARESQDLEETTPTGLPNPRISLRKLPEEMIAGTSGPGIPTSLFVPKPGMTRFTAAKNAPIVFVDPLLAPNVPQPPSYQIPRLPIPVPIEPTVRSTATWTCTTESITKPTVYGSSMKANLDIFAFHGKSHSGHRDMYPECAMKVFSESSELLSPLYNNGNFRSGVVSARIGDARPLVLIVAPTELVTAVQKTTELWGGLDLAFMPIDRIKLVTQLSGLSRLKVDLNAFCKQLSDNDEFSRSVDLILMVFGANELVGCRGIYLNNSFDIDPEVYASALNGVMNNISVSIGVKVIFAGFESMGTVKSQYTVEDGKTPTFHVGNSNGFIYRRFVNLVHMHLNLFMTNNHCIFVNGTSPHPSHLIPNNNLYDSSGKPTQYLQKCISMVLRAIANSSLLGFFDDINRVSILAHRKFQSLIHQCIGNEDPAIHKARHQNLLQLFEASFPDPPLPPCKCHQIS